ncbi:MAG: uridine kinase family protein [Candidatus Nanopelagicaceae bacterium]|jgi:uridine kinase
MVKTPQIILIDGPAGSGKTTLSKELQSEFNCQVVHLDDHYNGWDEALNSNLTDLLLEIVENFLAGRATEAPTFNWQKGTFEGVRRIESGQTLIIEGVGAGQGKIRSFATKLYWVEAGADIAFKRVLDRDGPELEAHIRAWQIREAEHFAVERTRDFADFIIATT